MGYVICANERCGQKAAPEDWQCEHCGSFEFLVPKPEGRDEEDDLFSLPPFSSDYLEDLDWRLCCDTPTNGTICQCRDETFYLSEVTAHILEADQDVYDRDSLCHDCVFVLSAGCAPYREWAKRWIGTEFQGMIKVAPPRMDVPEHLSACSDFKSNLDATATGVLNE